MKTKTDKELISEAQGLHDSIYVTECFGTRDLRLYDLVCAELERRGYEFGETRRLEITKGGEN